MDLESLGSPSIANEIFQWIFQWFTYIMTLPLSHHTGVAIKADFNIYWLYMIQIYTYIRVYSIYSKFVRWVIGGLDNKCFTLVTDFSSVEQYTGQAKWPRVRLKSASFS